MLIGELEVFAIPWHGGTEAHGNGHPSPQVLIGSDGIWPFESLHGYAA